MGRRLRTLGFAFISALAVAAVVAPAALAVPEFTGSGYPTTATGSNSAGSEAFVTEAGAVECDSHIEGSLSEASSTWTLIPVYTNCSAFGFVSATVDMEGCNYRLHATERLSAGHYRAHVDIVCPAGKSIKVAASTCKMEIGEQTGITTITLFDWLQAIRAVPDATAVAHKVTQDGFLCPFNGTGEKTNGEYTGEVTISRVGGGEVSVSGE